MRYEYKPQGVCSRNFIFDIEDGVIKNMVIEGGCTGNTKGVSALCAGRTVDDVISLLDGIPCRPSGTSCPDQVAQALKEFKIQNA